MNQYVAGAVIKELREKSHLTQAELARQLGVTRAGVNAWEQGISVPSTQYIVELAQFFHVSTDLLLCVEHTQTLDVTGLSDEEIDILYRLVEHFRKR